jgi:tetratricopeptide (TPR) repeat protein
MADRLAMLEKMVAAGSKDPFHWYARAMEYRSVGRLDEALTAYDDVRERFPEYVPTYLMAAQVCHELARFDDARTWLEAGLTAASNARDGKAQTEIQQLLDIVSTELGR